MSTSESTNSASAQNQAPAPSSPTSAPAPSSVTTSPALDALQAVAAATGTAAQMSNIDPQQIMSLLRHLPEVFNKVSRNVRIFVSLSRQHPLGAFLYRGVELPLILTSAYDVERSCPLLRPL